jgi:hypothetical protein
MSNFFSVSPLPSAPYDNEEQRAQAVSAVYTLSTTLSQKQADSRSIVNTGKPILLLVTYMNGAKEIFEVRNPSGGGHVDNFVSGSLRLPPSNISNSVSVTLITTTPIYELTEVGMWRYVAVITNGLVSEGWRWFSDWYYVECVSNCDGNQYMFNN